MENTKLFDVLVVYTDAVAKSATSQDHILSPFQVSKNRTHYNDAYAYLLKMCEKGNIDIAFATSKDISGSGKATCYWLYQNNNWKKVHKDCFAPLIFDKLSPVNAKQKGRIDMLFSDTFVKPFNNPFLASVFFDKQKTFDTLPQFSIPTDSITNKSENGIKKSLKNLRAITSVHPFAKDFSKSIVLKDRFGSGGNNVHLIKSSSPEKEILKILKGHKNVSFILQPFIKFNLGFSYKKHSGPIDIRMIFIGQKLTQVYIRTAKETDFRCNEHQGGQLHYIKEREVPLKVRKTAQQIARVLDVQDELYALDLVVSNSGNVILMEGNIKPGIDWNLAKKKNEKMAKQLIRRIAVELGKRRNFSTNSV